MLESMVELGKKILESQDKRESMIVPVSPWTSEKEPRQRQLVKINFQLDDGTLVFDCKEQISGDTAGKYDHFGRDGGPNSSQWYVTTVSSPYLLSEVVHQLAEKLPDGELKERLTDIQRDYFLDFGDGAPLKYRYLLNLPYYGYMEEELEERLAALKMDGSVDKPYKKLLAELDRDFKKAVQTQTGCSKKQQGLYTLCVNGQPITEYPDYHRLIEDHFSSQAPAAPAKKKSKNKQHLQCSYCGSTDSGEYLSKAIDFSIKYYNTGQLIFASQMNKKHFDNNMVLCRECHDAMRTAENYIKSNLSMRLGGFEVYLVPHYIFGDTGMEELDVLFGKIIHTFNSAKAIVNYDAYRGQLDDLKEESGDLLYLINLIFYKRSNQSTKILKMVADVSADVFEKTDTALMEMESWRQRFFERARLKGIGFNSFYENAPVKLNEKDKKPVSYRHVLNLYEIFFNEKHIDRKIIIGDLCECIRIKWFEQPGYNASEKDGLKFFEYKILRMLAYMRFLEAYGMLERSEGMDVSELMIPEDMKEYVSAMGYDEDETCLFLLGTMIGSIGRAQKRESGEEGTYKPILNKLNFNGMDRAKVKRLSSEIFNKMRQTKVLRYNEKIYAAHKTLLDKGMQGSWPLNKDENLFYILSGYSYQTVHYNEPNEPNEPNEQNENEENQDE